MILKYPITSDLLSVIAMWSAILRAALHGCDLTLLQYRVLNLLQQHGGSMNAADLAVSLKLSAGSLTSVLNKLELENSIIRAESTSDRRRIIVTMLPGGEDRASVGHTVVKQTEDKYFESWGRFLNELINSATDTLFAEKNQDYSSLVTAGSGLSHYTEAVLDTGDAVQHLLKTNGVLLTEFRILFELRDHQNGIHLNELARLLLLSMSDVTTATDKLVERGLIIRNRDQQDRRSKLLEINTAGFAVMEDLAVQVDECLYRVAVNTGVEQRELFLKSSKLLAEHQRRSLKISKPLKQRNTRTVLVSKNQSSQ